MSSLESLESHRVIRILALLQRLQRKTLIETKNRTLKCLKWRYSTVRSIKNVAVLTEDGASAVFFVPTPGNLPSKAKKCQCTGVSLGGGGGGGGGRGGWSQVELTDA